MKNNFPEQIIPVAASSLEEAHKAMDESLKQLEKVLKGSTGFVLIGIARHGERDAIINMAGGTLGKNTITTMLEHGVEFCKQLTRTPIVECDCPACQAKRQTQTTH